MGSDQEQVLVEVRNSGRVLTLNRPKQLNALSFQMVSRLLELFLAYDEDPNVKVVILKGTGRGFCSGGDVATVARDIRKGDWRSGTKFFSTEFTLNYVMATYSKPQVSILHGIVMGGGNGASMHGQFRVVTDSTVFAMPETALGLIPDVGATYFLSRLPGFFGEYLGLTGARLDGAEMLACGLATHFVPTSRLSALEAALCTAGSSDPTIISGIIDQFSELPNLREQSAYNRLDIIERCFSRRTLEEILSALERELNGRTDSWISSTIQMLKLASPTSLKVCLKSIREGRLQSIGQCLVCEYRLVSHLVRGDISKDFHEGCRALLLDKDKKPKWEPSRLELVSDEMVDQYFMRLNAEDWQDLKLPPRPNLPVHAFSKL